jgi:ATP-dependent helicase/nuclease subunit A
MSILSLFDLKGTQQDAAERLDTHLAVTAGAGSGKTRALVGRYLHFVETGAPLRSLIAITFTEKAAREMRSRIRREIENWLADPTPALPRPQTAQTGEGDSPLPSGSFPAGEGPGVRADLWQTAFIELDSARIGTIHSLCADLLRLYPAEAGVDPRFAVLEEGRAAMLQAEAIETALAWAATDAEAAHLFAAFKESELRRILNALLLQRLDAAPALPQPDSLTRWEAELRRWLDERLRAPAWTESTAALGGNHSFKDDDKLEIARRAVLAHWHEAQRALAASEWDASLAALRELRGVISTAGQAKNWDATALEAVREAMKTLRDDYEETLKPVLKDDVSWELDRQAAALLPTLHRLFEHALSDYQSLKDQSFALDFDDLEALTVRLLNSPLPSALFPAGEPPPLRFGGASHGLGVRAILVDEFQDTNDRQRQIVYALAGFNSPLLVAPFVNGRAPSASLRGGFARAGGEAANLFIVGDAKQGIYRFRGADVTVFRRIQDDIAWMGGEVIDLDLTFRAHAPLLKTVEQLLSPLMGTSDDPARPHHVPFAPLTAHRARPRDDVRSPFVEFHIGLGDAEAGRRAAAVALAARLHELHAHEGFGWEHMALLFRASTAFPVYEDALEAAAIPFVTVAGKGFYDRPEIRDLLNALTAITDPTDDLALAGLLRSPAFGLSDADLYHLRFPDGGHTPRPIYQSLITNPHFSHMGEIIDGLHTLAGRLPVAELLKHFLDLTHYRAILKAASGAGRLSRNVDKLLADAHRSRLVSVGDFLEYVQALRDVGAREGEAPADPSASSGGGAVQLMTVHKSKGLEFPLVVIADAAYDHHGSASDGVRLDPALGLLLKVTAGKTRPVAWQLGALADDDREAAEDLRLLYVAATRAKEKLIVNGHAKISAAKSDPGRLMTSGWLKQLGAVVGLDSIRLSTDPLETPVALELSASWTNAVTVELHPLQAGQPRVGPSPAVSESAAAPGPLVAPLAVEQPASAEALVGRDRVWRVITAERDAPAWVVGKLVHEALRRWTFADLETRLRPVALKVGLTGEAAIHEALREAARLLERFRAHPLFAEIDAALERHHEVPYVLGDDAGVIDLLYRTPGGWVIADFKTDELRDESQLAAVLPKYRAQLERYVEAVTGQLNLPVRPLGQLVFLNLRGAVKMVRLEDGH